MNKLLMSTVLLVLGGASWAEPVVYTSESQFRTDLATLGYSIIHESFEDDVVWADSRNSIVEPGSTPSVTSQGVVWTSNYPQNDIATGDVGGSAPDGAYAIYSLPHGNDTDSGLYCDDAQDPIPVECWLNDGLKIQSANGEPIYAFGGRIDTANSGKITFMLDGIDINANDTDNIDNWQREGEFADNWQFVGVIDTAGFTTAELKELRGKDFQQVLLFADDFYLGVSKQPVAGSVTGLSLAYAFCRNLNSGNSAIDIVSGTDTNWNCTDQGFVAGPGATAVSVVSGSRDNSGLAISGSVTGLSPVVAICSNMTTGSQVFQPLAGSGDWNCDSAGLPSSAGDKLRIIQYGTIQ